MYQRVIVCTIITVPGMLDTLYSHYSVVSSKGHVNNTTTMQFFTGFPEILSQNLIRYHWLRVSGISKIMHCGLLINMPYWGKTAWRIILTCFVGGKTACRTIFTCPIGGKQHVGQYMPKEAYLLGSWRQKDPLEIGNETSDTVSCEVGCNWLCRSLQNNMWLSSCKNCTVTEYLYKLLSMQ